MSIKTRKIPSPKKYLLMVGPYLAGPGGVSTVIKTWSNAHFFDEFKFNYVSSRDDGSKLLALFKGFITFLFYLTQSPDIIYIHCSAFRSFYRKSLFIIFASLFRHKIIIHIHSTMFYNFYSALTGFKKWYATSILKRAYTFIVLTEEMRDHLSAIFPEKAIYVLRNSIDVQAMANKEHIQRLDNNLLYLGSILFLKGVYELVDAMAVLKPMVPSVHLHFFGQLQEMSQLRNYVNAKNLENEITLNDYINSEEKIRQFYTSTLLALPSHTEGIPNVILEAMATKTPIVATHVGGLKEILRDGENALIVNVGDSVDLSDKILTMLHDRPLRERLAEIAYRDVNEKYDVSIVKTQFRHILEKVF